MKPLRACTSARFSIQCSSTGVSGTNWTQFEAIKSFLKGGGSAAFLLGEGGEERLGTNVNYLLEEYGMTVHKDSVVRKAGVFGAEPSCR